MYFTKKKRERKEKKKKKESIGSRSLVIHWHALYHNKDLNAKFLTSSLKTLFGWLKSRMHYSKGTSYSYWLEHALHAQGSFFFIKRPYCPLFHLIIIKKNMIKKPKSPDNKFSIFFIFFKGNLIFLLFWKK